MSTPEKLLKRLRTIDTGWRLEDLRKVAESVGIEVVPGKGDHWKFRAVGKYPVVVDPGKGGHEVKPIYVRAVRDLVEDVLNERDEKA